MSYAVARMQKMKAGNLGGAYKHNERLFENHSNKDIDTEKSHLNYELTDRNRDISYKKQIDDYIRENRTSNRAVRKDAVLCDEWIITSDKQFFEKLTPEQTKEYFETAVNYFSENYGKENIAYASVHLDERTPHMHMGIVPMVDGKLSHKAMFDREELRKIQEELPKYLYQHGFEVERGEKGSEKSHLTTEEYKQKMRTLENIDQKIEQQTEVFETLEAEISAQYEERQKLMQEQNEYSQRVSELQQREVQLEKDISFKERHEKGVEAAISEKQSELETLTQDYNQKLSQAKEMTDKVRDFNEITKAHDEFKEMKLSELEKGEFGSKTLGGKVKIDETIFNRIKASAVKNTRKNIQLNQEMRKQTDLIKDYEIRLSNKNQIIDELNEAKSINFTLFDQYEKLSDEKDKLLDRLDIATKKQAFWRNKAKEVLPREEFKRLDQLTKKFRPAVTQVATKVVGMVKSLIRSQMD